MLNGSSRLSVPLALLNDYFKAILDRRFSDAEKVLQEIEANVGCEKGEFEHGFIQALKGIILMKRSNDQYTFLSKLNTNDTNALKKYYKEFSDNSRSRLHADYDRGYFAALAEYIRFLLENARSG